MNSKSRIRSLLKTNQLDTSVTGIQSFKLAWINLSCDLDFILPKNLRLGHLMEKIVSELIKLSSNYTLLYENLQIIKEKETLGEIDFILLENETSRIIHMELAYKFYLFDPNISQNEMHNWIGPNRNDSLVKKLHKLKNKQFPLLYQSHTSSMMPELDMDEIVQSLCFLVSLYVPFEYKSNFNANINKSIKGYYLDYDQFVDLHVRDKKYYFPNRKEWGMDPVFNNEWSDLESNRAYILQSMNEKQAPLCWQKHNQIYSTFFIVWW